MKTNRCFFFAVLLMGIGLVAYAQEDLLKEVIVHIKPAALEFPAGEKKAVALNGAGIRSQALRNTFDRFKIAKIAKAFPNLNESDTVRISETGKRVRVPKFDRVFIIQVADTSQMDAVIAELSKIPGVGYAARNAVKVDLHGIDPTYGNQWHLNNTGQSGAPAVPGADIKAEKAWEIFTGSSSVKIGIFDCGVDITHPEFSGKISGDVPDATGGYRPHGTHVAGIAAAKAENDAGGRGVDWYGQIVSKKIISGDNVLISWSNTTSKIIEAVNEGVNVLNNSWGSIFLDNRGIFSSQEIRKAFIYAYQMNCVSIASTGNDWVEIASYPAGWNDFVMAVGATTDADVRTGYSNWGSHIDVVAPGGVGGGVNSPHAIYSTWLQSSGESYFYLSGTSQAAPQVSGLASLVKGYYASLYGGAVLYNDDITNIIKVSADKVPAMNGQNFTTEYGYGRINALNALRRLKGPYTLTHSTATGGTVYATSEEFPLYVWSDELGLYNDLFPNTRRYEVRKTVTFPQMRNVAVWGVGNETRGWSKEEEILVDGVWRKYYFGNGFCEVVPGTVTSTSATLRTYVYDSDLPVSLQDVEFAYTVHGIPATITTNTTWEGDFSLDGNVTVNPGVTLTIAPGTVVRFANNATLTVNGAINAVGTQANPIRFTSATGTAPVSWSRVRVTAGGSVFKYCTIEYSSQGLVLYLANSGNPVVVENCVFQNNTSYGLYSYNSKAQVKSCEMKNNGYGVYSLTNPAINLIGNSIHHNTTDGIRTMSTDHINLFGNVIELNSGKGLNASSSAVVNIGIVYQWYGYNTIRNNGNDEVYASSGNPLVSISGNSIHSATNTPGYEVYNYATNSILYAQNVWWDINCAYTGGNVTLLANIVCGLPDGSPPYYENWEGQPRTAGSPIGKLSTPEPSDSIPWIFDPGISGAEKIKRCKEIIAANANSKEAATGLIWLYNIVRTDYVNDNLNEKKAFFTYLQTLKTGSGDSELGRLALRYMVIWKMLEGNASSVVKFSKEALKSFSGEERKWVLVDLVHTYLHCGQVPEASVLLQELREKFADNDNIIADLEVDAADVNGQLEQGLMKRVDISDTLDSEMEFPTEYALLQNYPNPFNPTTTINYQIPNDGMVMVNIYDALGREVRTLVNEFKSTGKYTVTFDAGNLASGLYIYKLVSGKYSASKKMLLLK